MEGLAQLAAIWRGPTKGGAQKSDHDSSHAGTNAKRSRFPVELSLQRRDTMNARAKFIGILLAGFAALAMSSLKAPARVVCNTTNECWHVQSDFPPSDALTYHPDDWLGVNAVPPIRT
jgi:hypothetical protein